LRDVWRGPPQKFRRRSVEKVRYEVRRNKVVLACNECGKEHLREKDVALVKRFKCVNGCPGFLKPKERYWP
jgi:ribosomal protein L44E